MPLFLSYEVIEFIFRIDKNCILAKNKKEYRFYMVYVFRVVLDTETDVFRDIEIQEDISLEELHKAILVAFCLKEGEMAAFYETNDDWEQGLEIPLIPMDDTTNSMEKIRIKDSFSQKNKMLYLYDFMKMWTFFVELVTTKKKEDNKKYPNLLFSKGMIPKKPPKKDFIS